jgi:hypothetical protein
MRGVVVTDLVVSLVLGGALFATAMFIKRRMENNALDQRLAAILFEARNKLPDDALASLTSTLAEIREVGQLAALQGQGVQHNAREMKRAAIHTVASFLEIERMLPTPQPEKVPASSATAAQPLAAQSELSIFHSKPSDTIAQRSADLRQRIAAAQNATR